MGLVYLDFMPPPITFETSAWKAKYEKKVWAINVEAPVGFVLAYNDLHWSEDTLYSRKKADEAIAEIVNEGLILCENPDCDNCGTRDFLREPPVTAQTLQQFLNDKGPEERAVWMDYALENGILK